MRHSSALIERLCAQCRAGLSSQFARARALVVPQTVRRWIAGIASVGAVATLTMPVGGSPKSPDVSAVSTSVELCRFYLDPHDRFTRVVAPSARRAAVRASAVAPATITVRYTGFSGEAQTAFQAAVDIWQTQIVSSVPIVVDARFMDLGPTVGGLAGFRNIFADFPGAPLPNVFYPGPIANRLSGVDRDGVSSEIYVTINSSVNWSYGTDGVPVAGKGDLVTGVLHALGHGLGFVGSASMSASSGRGFWGVLGRPYTYDLHVVDGAGTSILDPVSYPNGSVQLGSLIRGTGLTAPGLFWNGPFGTAANGGVRPRLHAPAVYEPEFSYSHLDEAAYPAGNPNSLMTPIIGSAEVIHITGSVLNGMMADIGWSQQCSFGLSFSQANVGAAGGPVNVALSTSAGCAWTASTSSTFVSITANSSGSQGALIQMIVAPNIGTVPRVATVQIGDQTLTIAQDGTPPCAFVLSPASATVSGAGGSGTVEVQTLATCGWTATASPAEAVITNPSTGVESATITGVATQTITYTVKPNPTCNSRSVTLTVGGRAFIITQGPAPPMMAIDRTSLRFGAVASGAAFSSQTGAQIARLTAVGTGVVTWTATSSSPWLAVSPASGSGPAVLSIAVQHTAGLVATQTGNVTIAYTGAANSSSTISVALALVTPSQAAAPFGSFDTPANGSAGVVGSIPVTGWALDDVGVTRVRIMRDPVAGEPAGSLIYIGGADLVDGARPDVQAQFLGLPRASRAGWGYLMLTNFLPNLGTGVFRLTAIADDAEGHSTVLGSHTITCTNASAVAPFGAIDTPSQGGTASGNLINFGWVLSRAPRRSDPPSGGTVQIAVDGAFIPQVPSGWTSRADLDALFPLTEYPGIGAALGVAAIDTTLLANAVHTIAWVVTDNQGTSAGVGSRYFTVANDSAPVSNGTCVGLTVPAMMPASTSKAARALSGRRGYDRGAPFHAIEPGPDGRFTIQSEEIDRLEVQLGAAATGFLRVAGELAPLPVGSRIDPATGVFTWQPGVGFVGPYDFLLDGREVRIVLNPKGSSRVGPQVAIDVPSPSGGDVPSPSFLVAGWAADLDATIDGGVDTVHVWAYPVGDRLRDAQPIFLGAAAFGGVRPDVAAIYGDRFGKSGYGLEVRGLAPGDYDLAVFAYSTVRGGFAPAKTVRVTVR